jgi:hypothetical protein
MIPNIEHALSFLDGHGEADRGHIAELEAALGGLQDPADQREIALAARVLGSLYPRFFAAANG